MKKRKLSASLLLCATLFCAPHAAHAFDAMDFEQGPLPITVHVDGEFLPMDVAPVVMNGRTLVPLRAAGEAVGAIIRWDGSTQSAIAILNNKNVRFTLGSKTYTVNGVKHQADVAPVVKNNRTLLPLRAFGEACGVEVSWDNNLRDVIIDTPAENAVPLLPAGISNDVAMMIRKYYVQNEPNTSIVGNWQGKTYLQATTGSSNATTTKNYLFISRYGEGYQAVLINTEQANFYTGTGIFIQKLSILQGLDTVFYISPDNHNSNMPDESILYYRVPGNGYSTQLMHGLSRFDLSDGQLVRTVKPTVFNWEECYEPYTKF